MGQARWRRESRRRGESARGRIGHYLVRFSGGIGVGSLKNSLSEKKENEKSAREVCKYDGRRS